MVDKIVRASTYCPGKFYENGVECHLCEFPIDLQLSYFSNGGGVNPLAFSEDHLIPKVLGGGDTPDNLYAAHSYCNGFKGGKLLKDLDLIVLKERILEIMVDDSGGEVLKSFFDCLFCGRIMVTEPARLLSYNKSYCSVDCKNNYLLSKRTSKNCKNCGRGFTVTDSRSGSGRGVYCSMKCYNSFGDRLELTCEECGRGYFISSSNGRSIVRRYCSKCRKFKW